jgi:hypothetical protein
MGILDEKLLCRKAAPEAFPRSSAGNQQLPDSID